MISPPGTPERRSRILIVDDEPHNRQLLEVMLTPEGYHLSTAVNGVEALAKVAADRPDLILLDVAMPGMDGYEVAERLKADIATKNIPIIMVTVRDDREAKMRGLTAGAEDFLSKPVDRAELQVRVRNLLRLKAYGDYHDRYSRMLEAEVGVRTSHLLDSEARYRRIVETSNEGIWELDADGNTSFMNGRMAQMLGCEVSAALGLAPSSFLYEHGLSSVVASLESLRAGRSTQIEVPLKRSDGAPLWVLLETSAIFDASRQYEGALVMVMDISERRKAQEANLERMRIAELTAEVGVALTQGGALHDVLQRCAEAMVQRAGAACARIWTSNARLKVLVLQASAGTCGCLGASPPEVIPPEVRRIAGERTPYTTNDVKGDSDVSIATWAEREGMVAFAGHPMLVSGELVGVISIFARHMLSEPAFNGLEAIANEIAIGVHRSLGDDIRAGLEGQLRQAQKMEAVGRLAGGVAHDFNNVLSVILSYADLMLDTLGRDDPMRDDVDEIRKAGNRAADLTRQLLMFSRQQMLEPKVLDLNDVLSRMDKMLQRILGEDVELVFVAGLGLGRLRADPSSVEQVVMNLVVNARDAMPTGGKLTIETANVDLDEEFVRHHVDAKAGPYVMLAVSDTGIGMDAATRSRIFEPFFTTKPVDKGTGLGLSTVFGIAQQSGGCVYVYSEPGRGTSFKIYLPRVDREIDVDKARVAVAVPVRRGTETILLVDDDEQVRLVARGILRKNGYHVIDAKHAGEALLVCEQHVGTIHLLLTDVVMPQMSGPELAKRLAGSRPGMRVMCMSGYTDDSIVRHGILETEIAYLQKPITPESLTRKVREVLDA
ncbi:MAG: two-component hybrid sensor and regulator [Myxococcaceae bacterium]|nr:two-component hybrid sensor and regulator [Myxococcaceae bacterium]MEA2751096.1 two-component system, cell cycle sensor histidine kinase and response regulator CckA [Myxococcales bacterium]